MTQELEFPGPEPGDPGDVSWPLQTAGTMWGRGDTHEAIRWLRRAAEAAGDSGADLRAVTLARAAADLTTALDIPPSMPPPAAVPAPVHDVEPVTTRPSARPSSAAGLRQRQALRVSVRPADGADGELVVRPLAEGEAPADGEHEALLVALEAGAHLLSKKR